MANGHFTWTESKQDALAMQLVTIGANLQTQGVNFGVGPADAAYWQYGAAVNSWLQTQVIPAVRDFSSAATASRDELQLDKTVAAFVLPTFTLPPAPVPGVGTAPLQTDFLDWCDKIYQRMKFNGGLSDAGALAMGFLVPAPAPPIPPSQLKPRIVSIDTQAGGKTVVTASRDGQKMVHCRLTLDSGQVMDKTLATTQFTFMVPVDRVHRVEATAIYADRNGADVGQWSDPKSDTSEL